jgi:hypothetical protein
MKTLFVLLFAIGMSVIGLNSAHAQGGTATHYQANISFNNKFAHSCPNVSAKDSGTFDLYFDMPAVIGKGVIVYEGALSGWTSNGMLLSGSGRIVRDRKVDTFTLGCDTLSVINLGCFDCPCAATSAKFAVTLVPVPYTRIPEEATCCYSPPSCPGS